MWAFISWAVYGLFVGLLAKTAYSLLGFKATGVEGGVPLDGFIPTVFVGIVGSYVGGLINYVLGNSHVAFAPSGVMLGTIGAVVALVGFEYLKKRVNP